MTLRIHHLALRAPDTTVTERFYAGVLGLRVVRRDQARGSVWLDAGGAVVMIERGRRRRTERARVFDGARRVRD